MWTLLVASEPVMASKQHPRSDLTSDLKSIVNIHVHIAYMLWAHFVASEATTASKTALEVEI